MSWYITNKSPHPQQIRQKFYTNLVESPPQINDFFCHIDGYVIPRINYYHELKERPPIELVQYLFEKHGREFVNFIKGIFTIIIFHNDEFLIFTDRHGAKKYFIYRNNDIYFIGSSLKTISEIFELRIDFENAAVFSLLSHFINGATLFKNVESSKPGQILNVKDDRLSESFYWQPQEILRDRNIQTKPLSYFASKWQSIMNHYIEYLEPGGISITLTGGNDSRMVLAALMSLNKQFHAFSFGNPESHDGVIARRISDYNQFDYSNYFVKEPTAIWFEEHAKTLIESGNSLVNIHRAHRNEVLNCAKTTSPANNMLFTGLMGGEYLKEPHYDNIVIPKLFRDLQTSNSKQDLQSLLNNKLQMNGFNTSTISTDEVYIRIKHMVENGNGFSDKEKKFLYTYLFYGCSHHTQDILVFGQHFAYVVNPFMDVDFLEMISGYQRWYLNKKSKLASRLFHSELIVGITDFLSPKLSGIPYAKRGEYNANELLRNKAQYMVKSIIRLIIGNKNRYPANFPVGEWLYEFCAIKLKAVSKEISSMFNTDFLNVQLEENKKQTKEENWHIITNPINLFMIHEYYGKI